MADPKYAGLPGIDLDQPDTFETTSDHETDGEEESDSDQSETLHLTSLSWLGEDLEILQSQEKESLVQKFTRLRCEVNEFSEDLNSLAESAREGTLTGLHQQVLQLQEQLEVCALEQDGGPMQHSLNQNNILENLKHQIEAIGRSEVDSGQPGKTAAYDLYLQLTSPVTSDTLARLDGRLARLEKVVGAEDPGNKRRVLSVGTDSMPLLEALECLEARKYALSSEHLAHVEGRIAALVSKLNALKEQKEKVSAAQSASEVSALFTSLERRAGIATVLPDVINRLEDVKELHQTSVGWSAWAAEVADDQERTETQLAENMKQIEETRRILSQGLQGITQKLDKLQTSLKTIQA